VVHEVLPKLMEFKCQIPIEGRGIRLRVGNGKVTKFLDD
jgi:hypothetical protein